MNLGLKPPNVINNLLQVQCELSRGVRSTLMKLKFQPLFSKEVSALIQGPLLNIPPKARSIYMTVPIPV